MKTLVQCPICKKYTRKLPSEIAKGSLCCSLACKYRLLSQVLSFPIGSEVLRKRADGKLLWYVKVSKDKTNRQWKRKDHILLEKEGYEISPRDMVIYRDGDTTNCCLSNLWLTKKSTIKYSSCIFCGDTIRRSRSKMKGGRKRCYSCWRKMRKGEHQKPLIEKICLICGKKFVGRSKRFLKRICCSTRCGVISRMNRISVMCPICHKARTIAKSTWKILRSDVCGECIRTLPPRQRGSVFQKGATHEQGTTR